MAYVTRPAGDRTPGAPGWFYLVVFPVPVVFFATAAVTDLCYAATEFLQWLHFSQWLIAAGLAFGAIAFGVLLIELAVHADLRSKAAGLHAGCLVLALVVELFNAFVHTRDGWTAVVPTGLALSAAGALLALVAVAGLFAMRARGYASWSTR